MEIKAIKAFIIASNHKILGIKLTGCVPELDTETDKVLMINIKEHQNKDKKSILFH